TTPVAVPWILAVGHFQFNHPGDRAHLHRAVAPMHRPQAAEGGKPRHGGRLLLAVVAGVAGSSSRFGHFAITVGCGVTRDGWQRDVGGWAGEGLGTRWRVLEP